MHSSTILDWLAKHPLEAGLTARMSAAGLVAFAIGNLLGLTQIYWAVLTAVLVTQASIGGSLKAMIDRLIGTIGGAGWGVAVTLAVPHGNVLSTGLALAIALVPLAAVVALRPGYRIAPVTAAIVLLAYGDRGGVVAAAFNRVFEIGLGSIVALAVGLLVSPTRAHELLCTAGRDALALMTEQVRMLIGDVTATLDRPAVLSLHDRVRAAIERAAAVADDADRERRSYLTGAPDPDPLVRTLRRLSHDLVIVARALPLPDIVASRLASPAAAIAASLASAFDDLGAALATHTTPRDLAGVEQALVAFEDEIAALRREGVTRNLPAEAVERTFGLSFGFEEISRNLGELADRVRELTVMH